MIEATLQQLNRDIDQLKARSCVSLEDIKAISELQSTLFSFGFYEPNHRIERAIAEAVGRALGWKE